MAEGNHTFHTPLCRTSGTKSILHLILTSLSLSLSQAVQANQFPGNRAIGILNAALQDTPESKEFTLSVVYRDGQYPEKINASYKYSWNAFLRQGKGARVQC